MKTSHSELSDKKFHLADALIRLMQYHALPRQDAEHQMKQQGFTPSEIKQVLEGAAL